MHVWCKYDQNKVSGLDDRAKIKDKIVFFTYCFILKYEKGTFLYSNCIKSV